MKLLAANDDIPLPVGADEWVTANTMVRHYLKDEKLTEPDFIEILAHRDIESDEAISALLESKEVENCFGEEEYKLLHAWRKDKVKRAAGRKSYREKLLDRRRAVAKDTFAKKGIGPGKKRPQVARTRQGWLKGDKES